MNNISNEVRITINSEPSLLEESNNVRESTNITDKIKAVANLIIGYILEFFSFLAMSALYFVSQTHFDPKEKDIEKDTEGRAVQQPIVLVHGYLHNSSGWIYHRHRLNKAGFKNVFTVNLGAIPTKSIAEYAEVLKDRVEEIKKMTGRDDVKLVGHSMGGLVSSYYALNVANQNDVNVTDVITLNSPLQGTKMHIFGVGPCVRDMAYGSPFVKELSKKIASSTKTRFFHFASKADVVILPYYSALNIESEVIARNQNTAHIASNLGHTAVLFSKKVVDQEIYYLKGNEERSASAVHQNTEGDA